MNGKKIVSLPNKQIFSPWSAFYWRTIYRKNVDYQKMRNEQLVQRGASRNTDSSGKVLRDSHQTRAIYLLGKTTMNYLVWRKQLYQKCWEAASILHWVSFSFKIRDFYSKTSTGITGARQLISVRDWGDRSDMVAMIKAQISCCFCSPCTMC